MNGLDLFSGIGGLSIALEPWVRTIAYCEQDRYAQGVLVSRMRDGLLHKAPIWDDVRTLSAAQFETGAVDIIFGGFPCQDISAAGNGAGLEGERSGLFFEIARLTDVLRPRFVFLENVPAISSRGLDRVVGTFSELRYDCRWTIVSAEELGAPHLRKRWFLLASDSDGESVRLFQQRRPWRRSRGISHEGQAVTYDDGSEESLAHSDMRRREQCDERIGRLSKPHESGSEMANANGDRCRQRISESEEHERDDGADSGGSSLANSDSRRLEKFRFQKSSRLESACGNQLDRRSDAGKFDDSTTPDATGLRCGSAGLLVECGESESRGDGSSIEPWRSIESRQWWAIEPDVGRVAHGVPARVDRLRCLGNAVVPIQARTAFARLIGIE